MRKTINIDFDNSSSVILGYDPDILGTKASAYALSTHTHGSIHLHTTNVTVTYTSVSNGLTLEISAGAGGGGGTIHAGDNITLGTALSHTTISAYGLAAATHNHGGAPSVTGLIGGTIASNAWSISIPDFLLTAAASDHTHSNLMGNDTSTVTIVGTNLTLTADELGISFGVPRWITTAAQVSHTHGIFAGTNITLVSSGSTGLALSVAPGIGTSTSSNTVSGSTFYMSGNTSGLTVSIPKFITTAAAPDHTHGNVSLSLDSLSGTYSSDSAGLTLSLTNSTHAHDFIPIGSASDFMGINTAATNVTWTANTSGISFNAEGYAGTTTAATNVGLTVNSLGIRVSLDTAGLTSFGDGVNFIAGGGSTAATNTTIGFVNANRVSFSLNSDSMSASIAEYVLTGFTTTATAGTELVGTANSNGIKLGVPAFLTTETYSAIKGIIVSDSTYSSGSVSFSNANNISFGSSGEGVITASISYPTQSVQPVAISGSNTSITFSTLSLGTENGLTLYLSGSSLVGSYTVPVQSNQPRVVSINGTSGSLSISASRNVSINSSEGSAFTFYGPANILNSFSLGGNTGTTGSSNITGGGFILAGGDHITISQSNDTISIFADGGAAIAAQGIATTFSSGTVVLSGQANITLNTTEVGGIQYIRISGAASDITGADGGNILAAGSQTAQSTGNVKFINSNGVTFGMSNNSDITAIVDAISQVIVSDSTMISNFISFKNANDFSFGADGANIITLSQQTHEHTQYVGLLSTGVTGASATIDNSVHYLDIPQGSLYYQDGGGISWGAASSGLSTTITASVETNYLSDLGEYIQEVSLSGNNTFGTVTDISSGTLYLAGGNNITLSQQGNSITISGANLGGAQTGISGIADGMAASTVSAGTVVFANGNGISFGLNSNTMTASWQSTNYIGTAYLGYWQATEVNKGLMYTTYTQHTHGSNVSTIATTGTDIKISSSSNGITMGVPAYITAAGAHTHGSNVSTVSTSGTATAISFSSASDGLTVTIPPYAVTSHTHSNLYASVAHSHGSLYTSQIAGSVLTNSSNSAGLTLGIPAWLTTAGVAAHTHGSNVSLSTTNLLGASASSASNGLTLSISGYPATSFVNVSQSHILNFSDANGITFGSNTAGSTTTITANYAAPRAIRMVGSNTLGTTASISSGTMQLSAGSNITLSQNGNIIEIIGNSGGTGGAGNLSITAGTFSGTRDALSFANANNISFSMNGSTISGSVNVGTVYFSDSNSFSFGSSTSGLNTTITGSFHPAYVSFSDGGGVTWGTSVGSATNVTVVNATAAAAAGVWQISSNTAGTSSSAYGSVLRLVASDNITLSGGSNGISILGVGGVGGGLTLNNSTGNLSIATGSSLSSAVAGSTITFGLASNISTAWSGQTTANSSQVLQINGSSGSISFATGSSLSSSANASGITLGLASDISSAWSGLSRVIQLNGSSGSLSLAAGANITLTPNGNTISIVGASGGGAGNLSITAGTVSATRDALSFANANNVSFSMNGSTLSASISVGTVYFQDSNSFSFGSSTNSAGTSITGSLHGASVYFSDSNGFVFGSATASNSTCGSTTLTASYTGALIRAIGNTATFPFTSGSVMLSGANLTVNTSQGTGTQSTRQYLQISAPQIGYLFFSNANGHSWSSSTNGVSTSIYLVT